MQAIDSPREPVACRACRTTCRAAAAAMSHSARTWSVAEDAYSSSRTGANGEGSVDGAAMFGAQSTRM